MLQATVRVSLERANLFTQVQGRPARQAEQGFTPGHFELRQLPFRQAPRLVLEHRAIVLEHRWIRRTHPQGPLAGERRQALARQVETVDQDLDLALTETTQRAHRDVQRGALALGQCHVVRCLASQVQLAIGAQLHLQFLCLAREVRQVQRQGGLVATGEETRCRQFGDQGRGDHGFAFGHAVAFIGPGLGHHPQFTVEIRDVDADLAFTLLVQGHRCALQGNDGHAGVRALATLGQCRVAPERQAGQSALPGFDQLPVNVQLIGTIGFAPEQAGVRIRGRVFGDIEDADINRSQQHMHLFRHTAIGVLRLNLHAQRLFRAHFLRHRQAQAELALSPVQRQMQHANRALGGDVSLALAGTNHQCADIQVVARPLRIEFHRIAFTFGRHIDGLPPQRAIRRFHQQIPFTGRRRRDRDVGRVAITIGGFVQGQLHLVRTYRAAFGVVLGAVAGPEA
ncbi:hypothetical protein D3C78_560880 [compost metagenome]